MWSYEMPARPDIGILRLATTGPSLLKVTETQKWHSLHPNQSKWADLVLMGTHRVHRADFVIGHKGAEFIK